MEGKDTRHRKKRRDKKRHKTRPVLKPDSAIEGIIESSDDSDEPSQDRAYAKKPIESNWSRYDEPGPSEAERFAEDPGGADFEELANNPPAIGDHFQFEYEKQWGKKKEPDPNIDPARKRWDEYFELDLDLLQAGLNTIPFYRRHEFEKSDFSPERVQKMEAEAAAAEPYYKTLAKKHEEKMEKFYAEALTEDWLNQIRPDYGPPTRPPWVRDWPWGPAFGPGRASTEMDEEQSPKSSEIPKPEPSPGPLPKAASKPEPTPGPSRKPKPAVDDNDPELEDLLKLTNKILSYTDDDIQGPIKVESEAKNVKKDDKKSSDEAKVKNQETQENIQQWLDDVLNE